MLTAPDDVKDRVRGLKMGADDCLTNPLSSEELMARIEVQFRRARRDHPSEQPAPSVVRITLLRLRKELERDSSKPTLPRVIPGVGIRLDVA